MLILTTLWALRRAVRYHRALRDTTPWPMVENWGTSAALAQKSDPGTSTSGNGSMT